MVRTLYRHPGAQDGASTAAVREAWLALRCHLETRAKDLCEEVRHYPTPIARCDVQLTKLIEQRTHALASLRHFAESEDGQGSRSAPPSTDAMRGFIAGYAPAEDDIEAGLVARLKAALVHSGA